jgi:hypothetical protein
MIERSPGVWRLQVTTEPDPLTGKRRRLSRAVRGTRVDAVEAPQRLVVESGAGLQCGQGATVGGAALPVLARRRRQRHRGHELIEAVRWGWLIKNPVWAAQRPEVPRATVRPPTVDDVRALLASAAAKDFRVLVLAPESRCDRSPPRRGVRTDVGRHRFRSANRSDSRWKPHIV